MTRKEVTLDIPLANDSPLLLTRYGDIVKSLGISNLMKILIDKAGVYSIGELQGLFEDRTPLFSGGQSLFVTIGFWIPVLVPVAVVHGRWELWCF